MAARGTGDQATQAGDGTVPTARSARATDERRARIEDLQRKKRRSDRIRTVAVMGVCVIATGAFFAKPAYNWLDDKLNDPLKRSIASFGVPLGDAGCGKITDDKTSGTQEHVVVGTRVEYKHTPPSSGKHYQNPVPFAARPFFTTKDAPPVENLVHNMEHGYSILWYDSSLPRDAQDEIEGLAAKLRDDAVYQMFIATPWDPAYGELPDGKMVTLSHWSGPEDPDDAESASGHRLFCERLSGQAVQDFMDSHPATDAPERNIR